MNNRAIKLADDIFDEAYRYASVFSRSVPKQIEHWARIGKIAEENPDLSYELIKDILLSKTEIKNGSIVPYTFG